MTSVMKERYEQLITTYQSTINYDKYNRTQPAEKILEKQSRRQRKQKKRQQITGD